MGSATEPSVPTRLAQVTVLPQRIADSSNSRHAILQHLAHFAALQAHLGVATRLLVSDDLRERPRRADEHPAAVRVQRDVVDDRAGGYESQREDVAQTDGDGAQDAQGEIVR